MIAYHRDRESRGTKGGGGGGGGGGAKLHKTFVGMRKADKANSEKKMPL